jgi:hypothetical protein
MHIIHIAEIKIHILFYFLLSQADIILNICSLIYTSQNPMLRILVTLRQVY